MYNNNITKLQFFWSSLIFILSDYFDLNTPSFIFDFCDFYDAEAKTSSSSFYISRIDVFSLETIFSVNCIFPTIFLIHGA